MHPLPRWGLLVSLCALAVPAGAQPTHDHGHAMPKQTLLTARVGAGEVVPGMAQPSDATATGAFIISDDAKRIAYRLTWDRVASGAVTQIDVHNFGRGAVGASVTTLCGRGAAPCPDGQGATIEGTWAIKPEMLRELAVERTYVDIHTTGAKDGEVRGQILALPWMVHSEQYVGRFKNGTATLYVTAFPQGTQLQLDATVAGLPDGATAIEFRRDGARAVVGRLRVDGGALKRRGGTISGLLPAAARLAPLGEGAVAALRTGRATLSIVVDGKTIAVGKLTAVK